MRCRLPVQFPPGSILGSSAEECSSPELAFRADSCADFPSLSSRSGELQTQKLKSHLVRTQSLNVLPLDPEVSQWYIATHKLHLLPGISSSLIPTVPVRAHAFLKISSEFFLSAVANTGSCIGPQIKIGHPAACSIS